MTTVRELAKLAGVSRSTVSRALTGNPEVNAETRARILELAAKFQYHSHSPATASGVLTIGFLLPRISSQYFVRILKGIVQAAFKVSCHVIPLETNSNFETTRLALSTLIEQRVAGILIASGHSALIPREDIMRVWSAGIVPVCVDQIRTEVPVDTVQTDWARFAELVVNHFIALGHRYILSYAYGSYTQTITLRQRLACLGLPAMQFDDAWLSLPPAEQLRNIMAMRPRPTALFAGGSEVAARLVAEAQRSRVKIPGDLSVLASDNAGAWLETCIPQISSVEQFPEEIGKRAFELLYRRISEGCYRPEHPEMMLIPPKIIARESCGPPSVR